MSSFEENKKNLLEMLKNRKPGVKNTLSENKPVLKVKPKKNISRKEPVVNMISRPQSKTRLAFYSRSLILRNSLAGTGAAIADVKGFDNHQELIDWAGSCDVRFILLDIDPPTDWKQSMDIFTNLSMLYPNIKFAIVTEDETSVPASQMIKKGASAILMKPISSAELKNLLARELI